MSRILRTMSVNNFGLETRAAAKLLTFGTSIADTDQLKKRIKKMKAMNLIIGIFIVAVLLIQGCAKPTRTVGIDLKHGETWPGLAETLVAGGFRVVPINASIDAAMLKKIDVLMIMSPTTPYAEAEVQAIAQFVKGGGGLLCAGQAWSWTYKEYGNQPIETYPLNVLGKQLNFEVSEENAGTPTYLETEILTGTDRVERTDWWPSKVKMTSKDGQTILRDENQRSIGGLLPLGDGRIVLYGHASLLKDNPQVLLKTVAYVSRLPGRGRPGRNLDPDVP